MECIGEDALRSLLRIGDVHGGDGSEADEERIRSAAQRESSAASETIRAGGEATRNHLLSRQPQRWRWSDRSRMRARCRDGRTHRTSRSPRACRERLPYLLNYMVQYMTTRLDTSFAALSDATRRGVLEQLGRADASITDLAGKFQMTLTGMKKHVGVLEQAGLVTTKKIGRVRRCQLGPRRLEEETVWLERYRQRWDERFDELDKVVEELTRKEKSDERKNRK
jgi:DNA-binding transcriptional ArsR family regulator